MKKKIIKITLPILLLNTYVLAQSVTNIEDNNPNSEILAEYERGQYNIALNYFKNGDYEKSYEMFSNLFQNDMENILINFYLGRSAYETKRYDFAISAYDRILIKEPENIRVRLELAQTYLKMGLFVIAEEEFSQVLKGKMPFEVRKKVEENIALIKAKKQKHFFNLTALLSYSYDSNINASANAGSFDIYSPAIDSVITLENDGKKQSTSIFQLASVASYKYKINDNFLLNNSFTAMALKYNNFKDKDINLFSYNFTPTYFINNSKLELGLQYDYVMLGHETYQRNYHINPKISTALGLRALYEIGFKAGKTNYALDWQKDSKNFELTNSFKYMNETFGLFGIGVDLGKDIEINDYRTDVSLKYYNLNASHSISFLDNYSLQTQVSFKDIKYEDEDINFLTRREDKKKDYSLTLQKVFNNNLLMSVGGTYTQNDSNQAPFTYDKYVIKSSLIYSF